MFLMVQGYLGWWVGKDVINKQLGNLLIYHTENTWNSYILEREQIHKCKAASWPFSPTVLDVMWCNGCFFTIFLFFLLPPSVIL